MNDDEIEGVTNAYQDRALSTNERNDALAKALAAARAELADLVSRHAMTPPDREARDRMRALRQKIMVWSAALDA